jgi:hypothetical protein
MSGLNLRFGIMCNGSDLAAWERQVVDYLLEVPGVSLELLIIEGQPAAKPVSLLTRVSRVKPERILFTAYSKVLYKPQATRRVSIADLVGRVPARTCTVTLKGKFSQYFDAADVEAVAGYQLDFMLRFAYNIIRGKMLQVPRYGVWSFHHDDEMKYRGAPPCFWEIYKKDPVTGAILQRLTDKLDGGVVLKKGFFRTKFYSYTGTIDMVYQESAHWPAAICRQLQLDAAQIDFTTVTQSQAPIYYPPTNGQFIVFAAKVLGGKLRKLYELLLQAEEWNIGVVAQPIQRFLQPETLKHEKIDTAPLPNDTTFYADSFGRREGAGYQIYFESYDYRTARGTINRLAYPWQPGAKSELLMNFPFHLSYPYLIEDHIIPESAADNTISLYANPGGPYRPGPALPGLALPGVDSTVMQHEGRYWMFYTRKDRDPDLNLYLAYADALAGPWTQHPQNPVKTDVRSARPGGTPFQHEGRWYRPAQNFSRGYGGSVVINEILTLTTTQYAERPASEVMPFHPTYMDGLHTVSSIDAQHTVLDFKRYRFIPAATWSRLKALLGR